MPMLKIRNFSQADMHLTPPVPPPPKPGDPLEPAIPGVVIPRCTGTPGLPDHKPGVAEVPSEAIEACVDDPVVRSWFEGDSPKLEIVGGISFPPKRAKRQASAAAARDPEKDAMRSEIQRLNELLEQRTAPPQRPAAKPPAGNPPAGSDAADTTKIDPAK